MHGGALVGALMGCDPSTRRATAIVGSYIRYYWHQTIAKCFFERAKIVKGWQNEIFRAFKWSRNGYYWRHHNSQMVFLRGWKFRRVDKMKSSKPLKRLRAFKLSRNGKRTIIWDTKLVLTFARHNIYIILFQTASILRQLFLPRYSLLIMHQFVTPKVLV